MPDTAYKYRNALIHGAYAHVLKPFFFRRDPEAVHDRMIGVGKFLGRHAWGRALAGALFRYENLALRQAILGLDFANPIGLSAGFDKNAELGDILPSVGFGFAEMGSITGEPCAGNPSPRLWRLPQSRSLVVWYGLKNDGCEAVAARLESGYGYAGGTCSMPVGMSVAMTNCAENENIGAAVADFAKAFRVMEPYASYMTVNISCPNTAGGQPFIQPDNFERLFAVLDGIQTRKPVFIKLSPDMTEPELDALLAVVSRHRIHGIIASNLTKKRDNPAVIERDIPAQGGLSGKAVKEKSDCLLAALYRRTRGKYILIGSGGVFTAEDAYRKIRLGASLVQLITGMIYEGPQAISEINRGLAELLRRDGFENIRQAIGTDTC